MTRKAYAPHELRGCLSSAHPFFRSCRFGIVILMFCVLILPFAAAQDTANGSNNLTSVSTVQTSTSSLNETNATEIEDYTYKMMAKGIRCSRTGNYTCVRESFDAAHQALPNDTDILYNYAVALVNMKRNDEAVEKIDVALALDSEDPDLWYIRGHALKNKGDYAESGRSFERAEDLDPEIGVSFFDHYPANFLLNQIKNNIAYVVLVAGFGLLGIYIWFSEKRR